MTIDKAVYWKFPDRQGMQCRSDEDGVVRLVKFPGGLPSTSEQAGWLVEYTTYLASQEGINIRTELIAIEREKAISALIATEVATIKGLSLTALRARLATERGA